MRRRALRRHNPKPAPKPAAASWRAQAETRAATGDVDAIALLERAKTCSENEAQRLFMAASSGAVLRAYRRLFPHQATSLESFLMWHITTDRKAGLELTAWSALLCWRLGQLWLDHPELCTPVAADRFIQELVPDEY